MDAKQVEALPTQQGMRLATSKLVDLLKAGKPGDILTDEDLTVECERDTRVGGKGYGNLATAIWHVTREYGVIWRRQSGAECIRCLDASGIAQVTAGARRHIERTAKRALVIANAADRKQLNNGEATKMNAHVAQISAIALFSRTDTTKKLEARQISAETADLPKLLESFIAIDGKK